MVLCLKYLKLQIKKITAKKYGVNNPNSLRKNPDVYDPKIPNIFLLSTLDNANHPVSLKLNDIEDKVINNEIEKKIMLNILNKNFLFNGVLDIYSFSRIINFFKII